MTKDTQEIALPTDNKSRRTVLRAIGGMAGASFVGTGFASASGKKDRYVGYTYNPVTREIYGGGEAQIVRLDKKLEGVYKFSNEKGRIDANAPKQVTIPLSSNERVERPAPSGQPDGKAYRTQVGDNLQKNLSGNGRGYAGGPIPLLVETHTANNRGLTGEVRYPDEVLGVGFALEPVSKFGTAKKARQKVYEALSFRQKPKVTRTNSPPGGEL